MLKNRQSSRLKGYDYAQPGSYFVTLVTKFRYPFFGRVIKGKMHLSRMGFVVRREWDRTLIIRKNVELDAFIIMPDHLHGIIHIKYAHPRSGVLQCAPAGFVSPSQTLGAIIRGFKSAVTKKIHVMGNEEFSWQRNFHDRIIRDEQSLHQIREYIRLNPKNWKSL